MAGSATLCPPVDSWTGVSTFDDHTDRGTPSQEPGTDFYCPRFTPLRAAASGVVVEVFYGIGPATGRFISIDLDNGLRVRYLHLEEIHVRVGQRVAWGEVIGRTGATGYGEPDWSWNVAETGGAHVHMTVFPGHYYVFGYDRWGDPVTLDPQLYIALAAPAATQEEEPMFTIYGNTQRGYMIVGPDLFIEVGSAIEKATGVPGPAIIGAFQAAGAKEVGLDTASFDRLRISLIAGRPKTATVQPIIDVDVIRETIKAAFAEVKIDADVSSEDLDAIATRVVDVQAARLAQ